MFSFSLNHFFIFLENHEITCDVSYFDIFLLNTKIGLLLNKYEFINDNDTLLTNFVVTLVKLILTWNDTIKCLEILKLPACFLPNDFFPLNFIFLPLLCFLVCFKDVYFHIQFLRDNLWHGNRNYSQLKSLNKLCLLWQASTQRARKEISAWRKLCAHKCIKWPLSSTPNVV